MDSTKYIALIGDIVGSRQLPDRANVQIQLENIFAKVNQKFRETIAANFVITIGDEFQGLVHRDFPLKDFLQFFNEHFGHEIATRFGIGLGTLTTALKSEAIAMDGPCFHQAREALEFAKEKSLRLAFRGFEMNTAITALFGFLQDLENSWSARQKEIIEKYSQYQDQATLARDLQISRQAVFNVLKATNYDQYLLGWDGLQELFAFRA